MTTAGGGWTLVYKVRNDIPDISDPWWGMVALGSGTTLPSSADPLPRGTHFEGPVRDVRGTFFAREDGPHGLEMRASVVAPDRAVLFDVLVASAPAPVLYFIRGDGGSPTGGCSPHASMVLSSSGSGLPPAGTSGFECFNTCAGGTCQDMDGLRTDASTTIPIVGDDSIAGLYPSFRDSTTLFWLRARP
ncbi:MAG: hypothetical protein K8H88_27225 [Sandaracinaceae bacterium]|nr:hypothetical protein [Sandaracinaceae bacterium]